MSRNVKRPQRGLQSPVRAFTMTTPKQPQVSGYRKVPAPLDSPEISFIWRKPELQPGSGRTGGAGSNRQVSTHMCQPKQRPTAAGPFPQKVNTSTGVGSRARVAPLVTGERNTAGPTRTVQSGSGWWQPACALRCRGRTRRPVYPGESYRRIPPWRDRNWRAVGSADVRLPTVENQPPHPDEQRKRAIALIRGGVHHPPTLPSRGAKPRDQQP